MSGMLPAAVLLFLISDPQAAIDHERAGRVYEGKGELQKAAVEYEEAVQLSPYEESYYFEAAHVRLLLKQFDAAERVLERGCKVFDKSAQLELALGVAYYGERRFGDAAGAFLRTIDLAPDVRQPYVFLSKMMDQSADRVPEILPRFEKWAASNSDDAQAQFVYAKGILASNGDAVKAEELLRTSIRLKADQWESHYELGALLEKQRRFRDAAAELERSIALSPNQADAHYHLSRVYDRLGEPAKAAEQREIHSRLTAPGGIK